MKIIHHAQGLSDVTLVSSHSSYTESPISCTATRMSLEDTTVVPSQPHQKHKKKSGILYSPYSLFHISASRPVASNCNSPHGHDKYNHHVIVKHRLIWCIHCPFHWPAETLQRQAQIQRNLVTSLQLELPCSLNLPSLFLISLFPRKGILKK